MVDLSVMNTNDRPRLRMTGICRSFGAVKALTDVDFELRPGEIMALLGENGAGKSTLVKVLSGLESTEAGTIEIDGAPVTIGSSAQAQHLGVAVVQQEFSTIPSMSVADNLFIGAQECSLLWSHRRTQKRGRKLLDTVGLEHIDPRTRVEELTVAERQLLEIARVLARDARIIILDEPTATLSDNDVPKVLQIVKKLAANDISIIYVTHRLGEVFELADRVTVMRNGRSLPPMSRFDIDSTTLVTAMLGRELGALFPEHRSPVPDAPPILEVTDLLAPGLAEPVSFTLRKGEILGITGQLGSGTSEMLAALAGLIPASAGTVKLHGRPIRFGSRARGMRAGIAYCSPDRKLDGIFPELPLLDNLSSPWLLRVSRGGVMSTARERSTAERICGQFAINASRLPSPISQLSGGNQQKAVLGKWMGVDPQVILVEEPTRGVDIGARAEIYAHLRSLCDAGIGIVFVSTDSSEVLGLADSIGTFHGRRAGEIRPHDFWTEQALLSTIMHTTVSV